jgi:hypothetical protein
MAKKNVNQSNNEMVNFEDMKELLSSIEANVEALKEMSQESEHLNLLYNASKEKLAEINSKLKEMSSYIEELANAYSVSQEEICRNIDLLEQQKKIQKEINEVTKNYDADKLKELIQLEKELAQSIKDSAIAQNIASKQQQNQVITLRNAIKNDAEEIKDNKNEGQNEPPKNNNDEGEKSQISFNNIWGSLFNVFLSGLKMSYDKLSEVDQAARDFGRNIGMSNAEMNAHRTAMLNNWDTMAATLGMEFKEMYKFQVGYSEATERATVLTDKQVGSIASLSRTVGETAINVATQNLDTIAASADNVVEYLAKGQARATAEGLHLKKYSEAFAKNIKLASRFTFKEGVEGVQKMTLLSQRLKFDMQSIANAMDKFSTIEGAIETSAQIQVLGGAFANNFGNPLEVMAESLMDAEAFTKRIVNSVGNKAVFNRKTGTFDMSVVDKMMIKEYAKIIGISFDELFNMSTQVRKKAEIAKDTKGKFNDEELAWLANKAQYDAKKGWQYVDVEGNTHTINEIDPEELKILRKTDDTSKLLNSNVSQIKDFLIGKATDEKSISESLKGTTESYRLLMGSLLNNVYGYIKQYLPLLATMQLFNGMGLPSLLKDGVGNATKAIGKSTMGTNIINAAKGSGRVAGAAKGVIGAAKGIRFAAPLAILASAAQGAVAYTSYKGEEKQILSSNMSIDDQAQALNDAKKVRNKSYGNAGGGLVGSMLGGMAAGAIAGSIFPGIGNVGGAIVGLIGGALGMYGGGKIGEHIGELATESVDETKRELQEVRENIKDKTSSSSLVRPSTNDKMKLPDIKVNDMRITLGGKIQLSGDGNHVDVKNILANKDFIEGMQKMISNAIKRDPNGGVSPMNTYVS